MRIKTLYQSAKERYAALGVDTDAAVRAAAETPISLHCWQGDDVVGFEKCGTALSGGIQVTGSYPGRARTPDELRADMDLALSLIPGTCKVNLHASYPDTGEMVDRDALEPRHFSPWADWAVDKKLGLDFNSTYFSHPLNGGGTLTNPDPGIRRFWIAHGLAVRAISEYFAERTGIPTVTNHWIPDGTKEIPADTLSPRLRLKESLDEIFARKSPPEKNLDALESKLFGIGAESYTPGSHEFYLAYTVRHPELLLTLDAGHFRPTESVAAKISAILCFSPALLLHVSRPVRWDSDHVVRLDDETRQILREVVRNGLLGRVCLAADYFDASINRVAAWVVGMRNTRKALLAALLEPVERLKEMEASGDSTGVLTMVEESFSMPFGAVWDYLCETQGVPGADWLEIVRDYEHRVLSGRD